MTRGLTRTVTTAACLIRGCDWQAAGPAQAVDREARRHAGELPGGPPGGHAPVTTTLPVPEEAPC